MDSHLSQKNKKRYTWSYTEEDEWIEMSSLIHIDKINELMRGLLKPYFDCGIFSGIEIMFTKIRYAPGTPAGNSLNQEYPE